MQHMKSIGVREQRQNASHWLRRVARGESFEITNGGQPVALLVPVRAKSWTRLIDAGVIEPADGDLLAIPPLRDDEYKGPLSEILEEARSVER